MDREPPDSHRSEGESNEPNRLVNRYTADPPLSDLEEANGWDEV